MKTDGHTQSPSGIKIDAPRLINSEIVCMEDVLLNVVLILSGVFGAAWSFISAFSLPVLPVTVILYALLFTAVFTLANYFKRIRYVILFVSTLVYAVAAWYFRAEIVQGFIITTNKIMVAYANHSDYEFPIYMVSAKSAQYAQFCTQFLLFLLFIITGFVSRAVIKRKSFWMVFFATFPFLLMALIFTITPAFPAVLLLLACWATLIFTRLPSEKKPDCLKTRRAYRTNDTAVAARSGLLTIPAVILCFSLILTVFPQQNYKRPSEAEKLRTGLTDTVLKGTLLNGSKALAGNVNRVDLSNAGKIQFTGKTALQIKSEQKYPLYLKSFAGGIYTGSSWEQLPDSDYNDINQKLNGMNVQNMSHTFFTLTDQQNDPNLHPFGIQVRNISAAKQCIYAPYNLTTTPENITGVKFVDDAFIRSGSLFGTSTYSLYAYSFPQGRIHSDPAGVAFSLAQNSLFHSKSGKAYLSNQQQFSKLNESNVEAYYQSTLPPALVNSLEGKSGNFIKAEQDYRLFMYDKYTQLPQGTKEKIENLLEEEGISSGSYSSVESILQAVKFYLRNNCFYTLSPGKTPAGQDFADYFLTESHRGYCVHFATAATVMLRAMGVPARYAEGYVVTADDYQNAGADGWANIRDSRAHAWVEIYCPGLGWQPVEVTSGFNVEHNLTQDNNPVNNPPVSSANSTPPESTAESEPESKPEPVGSTASLPADRSPAVDKGDSSAAMVPVALSAAAVFVLLACAALKRRIVLAGRAKSFALSDTNRAAVNVYAYLTQLTRFGGEISAEVNGIALKARFSQHSITSDELRVMTDFARQLARQNYTRLSKAKRLAFKYIYNLI